MGNGKGQSAHRLCKPLSPLRVWMKNVKTTIFSDFSQLYVILQ